MAKEGLCSLCGITFKKVQKHIRTVHNQPVFTVNCDKCDKTFKIASYKEKLMNTVHKDRISYESYGKTFSNKHLVKRHTESTNHY